MERTSLPGQMRPRRLYYGWVIVGACNAVAFMTWGIGVFNQGVFLGYFEREFGWSRAALSLGPALFYVWAGLVGVGVGRVIDRRGPRPVLVAGALAMGGGTIALGLTSQPWQLYPAFLLLSTGYACLHTVTLGAIVGRWFARQRARAMAAATFGAGFGGMVLAPLNAALLERWGGPAGGLALAIIAIGVVVPLALWVVKDSPRSLGLEVDGGPPLRPDEARPLRDERVWTLGEAARTRAFWAIALSFHLTMIAQAGFLVHQVLFLQPTFGFFGAATIVSLTTVMGGLGRGGLALAGSRWSPRALARAAFLLQALGLLLSAQGPSAGTIVAGSLAFGLTMGVIVALQPVIAADCFGQRSFGRVYGSLYLPIQLGSALGPLLFGLTAAVTGSYGPGFSAAAGGLLVAALSTRWALPPVGSAPTR